MATSLPGTANATGAHPPDAGVPADEAKLLLDAFQSFTSASSSLEAAFRRLEARTRELSTELAEKNRQLKRSLRDKALVQNYLKRILQSLPCGVVVVDESGMLTLCNPVAARILKCAPVWARKQGSAACRGGSPEMREYFRAVSELVVSSTEVEIPFAAGDGMRTLAVSLTRLPSASGAPAGTLHIMRDVTEIKALQERNKRGERLSAMGEMAVELAHEIRNPLGSIELFASLLEKELPRRSDAGRWAENIRIGSRSLNNIVSNMLHFANPLAPAFDDTDMHVLVEEILDFTEPILRQRDVQIEKTLSAARSVIRGDRELLKQMLLNLVLNSLQAMPSRGRLRIATRDVDALPEGAACAGLELRVEDTGLGIPPENLDRVFDPFFTTNKNGTGLGLSVVHQIVEQHSGFITLESRVDVGTAFTIVFPHSRPPADAS